MPNPIMLTAEALGDWYDLLTLPHACIPKMIDAALRKLEIDDRVGGVEFLRLQLTDRVVAVFNEPEAGLPELRVVAPSFHAAVAFELVDGGLVGHAMAATPKRAADARPRPDDSAAAYARLRLALPA